MQQQHQHPSPASLSRPVFLILLSLVDGPKQTVELREAIEQRTSLFIEPGTLYRVPARLKRRGWIEGLDEHGPLRRYRLTALGILALEQAEAGSHKEKPREGRRPEVRKGKEIIMRLVLWILRLYPPGWRERYEEEMVALLAQHHITLWTVLDLLVGALDARLDPHYRRARQLLPLWRFQTSWRLVVGAFVAFWIALLPWFWMSALGIPSSGPEAAGPTPFAACSQLENNSSLCMMRVAVGMHGPQAAQTLVGMLLGWLPILLIAFTVILVLARGRKARMHLLLALPVTIGMIVLCISCGVWLSALWPLLPQISRFYPQTPAALLVGLVGMGLATVFALFALVRAAFALRALSAASPKQESLPFSWDQHEGQPAQSAGTAHLEHPTRSSPARSNAAASRFWIVVLAVLLLVFILPWPLLDTANSPPFSIFLGNWSFAGAVGIITALLVNIRTLRVWGSVVPVVLYILVPLLLILGGFLFPFLVYWFLAIWVSIIPAQFVRGRSGNEQTDRATAPPRKGLSAILRAVVVLLIWLAFSLPGLLAMVFGSVFPSEVASLIIFSCIYITPALVVKVYNRNEQAHRAAQKPRNRMSPNVWIIMLPVLFLVFCMQFEFLVVPDYVNWGDVLIVWFTTGLAGLIIALAVKIGSGESTALSTQEAL